MKDQIKYAIYLICLGASLVAYAHTMFTTKERVNTLHEDVREIRQDVKFIREKLIELR
jgi:bacteriorhodopsin